MPQYDLDIPYLIRGETKCVLRLFDATLIGSKRHFLRLDLYPLVAPSIMKRHYGWWDIPLSKVRSSTLEFFFSPFHQSVTFPGLIWSVQIKRAGGGNLNELGYCMLHGSLWEVQGNETKMKEVQSYPIVLLKDSADLPLKGFNIPVTDRCNLKCRMCPRQSTQHLVEKDISLEVLDPLLTAAGHVNSILLQGLGEPFLYKDLLWLIRRVKAQTTTGCEVGLTTNATLLSQEAAVELLEARPNFVYFSVDAATKAAYEKIRVGANFEQVIENIGTFQTLSRQWDGLKPASMLNFIVMAENHTQVPQFVHLASKLGVGSVTFSRYLRTEVGEKQTLDAGVLQNLFAEATDFGNQYGINVFVPPIRPVRPERCLFMERAVVIASGDVIPCHTMAPGYSLGNNPKVFGNVRRTPLLDIWHQPEVKAFRRSVLEGDFPHECENCECKAFLVP
jgi:radical SAM protein with 4Fe4S-binding SPASM domain